MHPPPVPLARLALVVATLLLAALRPSPARADHPPIILESYVGEKPADAGQVLAPLVEELASYKFVLGPEVVGRSFEAAASRPAVAGGLPDDFSAQVSQGYDLWTNGKFTEAAALLGRLVEAARENAGEFAKNQHRALYPQLQRARIALSLSLQRLGDRSAAKQAMGEALRGDPDLKISRGMFGQDAAELYQEVLGELTARGPGKVIIAVDAVGAGIYVNERLVEMGSLELNLLPGEYRVVARIGDGVTRTHRLGVVGGGVHKLTIDPAFDQAVRTGPGWTGFLFEASADRERDEGRYAGAFATAIDARQVAVVGIDTVRGRRMIRGALINKLTGRELRAASIPLDGSPSAEQRKNLARFLNGAPPTPDIIVDASAGSAGDRPGGGELGPRRWGGWKWISGGAAVAAGVAGGALLAYDGRCARRVSAAVPCPDSYDTAISGWLTVGGAVALAGVTVVLVATDGGARGGEARRTAYVAPTAGGALAGYAARF
ncbi:MAG TPA: hypothetical protein VNO30_11260 [Kofleriaceae bacterium]|nr:hypothetical protein [Kofleriaceae bacterium]